MYPCKYIKHIFANNILHADRKQENTNQLLKNMAVMAGDGPLALWVPSPFSLCLCSAAHKPSKRHSVQSLLGLSLHDPRTPHVWKSHTHTPLRLSSAAYSSENKWECIKRCCYRAICLHVNLLKIPRWSVATTEEKIIQKETIICPRNNSEWGWAIALTATSMFTPVMMVMVLIAWRGDGKWVFSLVKSLEPWQLATQM